MRSVLHILFPNFTTFQNLLIVIPLQIIITFFLKYHIFTDSNIIKLENFNFTNLSFKNYGPVWIVCLMNILTIKFSDISPNKIFTFLVISLLIAFAEEYLVRGIIFNIFADISIRTAIIGSSFFFAFGHLQLPNSINLFSIISKLVFTFGFGFLLATIRNNTNSIVSGIIAHFLYNFVIFLSNNSLNSNTTATLKTLHISLIYSGILIIFALMNSRNTFKIINRTSS